ncbi:hypothetical protein ZWY2020_025279 [Hordeum vulgare]|nr:hypothetical protein ZWY2020_025279 [Hordeum vulgare]
MVQRYENDGFFAHDIRRSVREAALSKPLSSMEGPQDKSSDDGSEHFFIPLSTVASRKDVGAVANRRKQRTGLPSSQSKLPKSTGDLYFNPDSPMPATPALSGKLNGHDDPSNAANFFDPVNGRSFMTDDALDQVFSPPPMLEPSLFHDTSHTRTCLHHYQKLIGFNGALGFKCTICNALATA